MTVDRHLSETSGGGVSKRGMLLVSALLALFMMGRQETADAQTVPSGKDYFGVQLTGIGAASDYRFAGKGTHLTRTTGLPGYEGKTLTLHGGFDHMRSLHDPHGRDEEKLFLNVGAEAATKLPIGRRLRGTGQLGVLFPIFSAHNLPTSELGNLHPSFTIGGGMKYVITTASGRVVDLFCAVDGIVGDLDLYKGRSDKSALGGRIEAGIGYSLTK